MSEIGLIIINELVISGLKLQALEQIIKLHWLALQDEFSSVKVFNECNLQFLTNLDNYLAKSKFKFSSDLTYGYLLILCPKYRQTEILSLIEICFKNRNHHYLDLHQICLYKSKVANHCIKFGPCFFSLVLTLAEICKQANGHSFIAKVALSLKKAVEANITAESIFYLYPSHLHPLVIQLRTFEQNFDEQSKISVFDFIKQKYLNQIKIYLEKDIYSQEEIQALLLIHPLSAKFIFDNQSQIFKPNLC